MLKSLQEIEGRIARIFESDWHEEASGLHRRDWPCRISLGSLGKSELETDFGSINRYISALTRWAGERAFDIVSTKRRVCGTVQIIPTHLTITDFDALVGALDKNRQARYRAGCLQASALSDRFDVDKGTCAKVIKMIADKQCDEADFELLCRASEWFASNDASELTARQVPLEGFHAKWLDARGHLAMIRLLCRNPDLSLKKRPRSTYFTYLDPDYLAEGGRRRDSITEGDKMAPAYAPRTVVISENKDTALWFPPLSGGISFEGGGWSGIELIGAQDWVRSADLVVYWGDMDAAGLEILNGYRANGLDVASIFMDSASYERYERYGTSHGKQGENIEPKKPVQLDFLTEAEMKLYLRLVDSAWMRPRRVEQERIPLDKALEAVKNLVDRLRF